MPPNYNGITYQHNHISSDRWHHHDGRERFPACSCAGVILGTLGAAGWGHPTGTANDTPTTSQHFLHALLEQLTWSAADNLVEKQVQDSSSDKTLRRIVSRKHFFQQSKFHATESTTYRVESTQTVQQPSKAQSEYRLGVVIPAERRNDDHDRIQRHTVPYERDHEHARNFSSPLMAHAAVTGPLMRIDEGFEEENCVGKARERGRQICAHNGADEPSGTFADVVNASTRRTRHHAVDCLRHNLQLENSSNSPQQVLGSRATFAHIMFFHAS